MNLLKPKEIREVLEESGLAAKKSFGQNFLIDENALNKILAAGQLSSRDVVIEVGPGLGALTLPLSFNAKKVVAIEKDKKIIPLLKHFCRERNNIEIIEGDILKYAIKEKKYKVVANVPYYITSPIIRKFLENEVRPSLLVLTVQKEVAERVIAKPPNMNLLAASVQFFAEVKIISHLSPSSFYPQPSVASSILQIIPYNRNNIGNIAPNDFFKVVRLGFSHPRKQISKNLKPLKIKNLSGALEEVDISPQRRAETLSVEEWKKLVKKILIK